MTTKLRMMATLLLAGGLVGAVVAFASADGSRVAPQRAESVSQVAPRPAPAPKTARELLAGLDVRRGHNEDNHVVVDLADGAKAILTVDPDLQAFTKDIFEDYSVPYGAVVALEPRTGRVLAYVSHSSANPEAGDLAVDATPPAASVFKIITGSALIDSGQTPGTTVCYSGGESRLTAAHLDGKGSACATLADAMGGSINAIFAKLADQHLTPDTLEHYAAAFGFGHAMPFDVPTQAEPAEVPRERLEFARTAAGFWHMHMSPLHGALIGATIANGGQMPRAILVDEIVDAHGQSISHGENTSLRPVISESTAHAINQMMQVTITQGTSRRTFHDPHGVPFLPGVAIAGKTGTLAAENPYRGYTWWVGFAPADHPQIAVAALVVNTPNWRIKANFVARETLRHYLVTEPEDRARHASHHTSAH